MNRKTLLLAVIFVAFVLVGSAALADEQKWLHKEDMAPREVGSSLEVHINENGTVLVRGAKVTGISGDTVTAGNTFGSSSINWTVRVSSDTQLLPKSGRGMTVSDIKVGDFISFSGRLDTNASSLTVNAKVIKDWAFHKLAILEKRTFEGKLKSISGTTLPTSFVLTISSTDYTVNVPAGISILNRAWLTTSLVNFHVGDNVRVYGVVQASSTTTIDATAVRDTSI